MTVAQLIAAAASETDPLVIKGRQIQTIMRGWDLQKQPLLRVHKRALSAAIQKAEDAVDNAASLKSQLEVAERGAQEARDELAAIIAALEPEFTAKAA